MNLVSNGQCVGWPMADSATPPLGVIAGRRFCMPDFD
jgi:hypothetical protein